MMQIGGIMAEWWRKQNKCLCPFGTLGRFITGGVVVDDCADSYYEWVDVAGRGLDESSVEDDSL